jgi:hypothetical protein
VSFFVDDDYNRVVIDGGPLFAHQHWAECVCGPRDGWDPDLFLAVRSGGPWRSWDLVHWERARALESGLFLYDIAARDPVVVAVGESGADDTSLAYGGSALVSIDRGATWTHYEGILPYNFQPRIVHGNGTFVVSGNSSTLGTGGPNGTPAPGLLRSTSGTGWIDATPSNWDDWDPASPAPWQREASRPVLVFSAEAGLFVVSRYTSEWLAGWIQRRRTRVWTSPDAVSWSEVTLPSLPGGNSTPAPQAGGAGRVAG